MQGMQPPEVEVTAIHHVEGARLEGNQVEDVDVVQFAVGDMDKLGMFRANRAVCAASPLLWRRESAHGNSDKHKSMVVVSSA